MNHRFFHSSLLCLLCIVFCFSGTSFTTESAAAVAIKKKDKKKREKKQTAESDSKKPKLSIPENPASWINSIPITSEMLEGKAAVFYLFEEQ